MLGAAAANSYGPTRPLANWLAAFSPLHTLMAADGTRGFGPSRFWQSAAAVAGVSRGCLGLTTLLLARTWRDRPKSVRPWHRLRFGRRSERTPSARRAALRRRLLAINPLFWLAARQPVSAHPSSAWTKYAASISARGMTPRNSAWLVSSSMSFGIGVAVHVYRYFTLRKCQISAVRVFPSLCLRIDASSITTESSPDGSNLRAISVLVIQIPGPAASVADRT